MLGFIYESDGKVGKVMMSNGEIKEIPMDQLGGKQPGQDIDLDGDGAATSKPQRSDSEPPSSEDAAPGPVQVAPRGKAGDRQQYAMKKLMSMGWSAPQAAGIVGRFMQESFAHLETGAIGDAGRSMGLGQWNGQRRANLVRFAREHGKSARDFDTQLEFFNHEIRNDPNERTALHALQNADSYEDAAVAMMHYERPRGYSVSNPARGHGFTNTVRNAASVLRGFDPNAAVSLADLGPNEPSDDDDGSGGDGGMFNADSTIDAPDMTAGDDTGDTGDDGGGENPLANLADIMTPDTSADDQLMAQGRQRIQALLQQGQMSNQSVFGDIFG